MEKKTLAKGREILSKSGSIVRIAEESTDTEGVDTVRFSRVMFLGAGTIKELMKMKVLVCGLDGLGAEISKGIILTGVGFVTLHDTQNTSWMDLSSHVRFFLPLCTFFFTRH